MRYARHIKLANFGEETQAQVEKARVLVIGAGGLGSPVLLYLVAAGVGTVGIVDDDTVDISNLHRQILHSSEGQGIAKTVSAKETLGALNPHVDIVCHAGRITGENAVEIISAYDLVVDCSDNFDTRYLINDVCAVQKIPHIWGAVIAYYGQVSVFLHDDNLHGIDLRDIYPDHKSYETLPSPQVKGTFGPLCGIVGSFMAAEALKLIGGIGELMTGRIALFDIFNGQMRTVPVTKSANKTEEEK